MNKKERSTISRALASALLDSKLSEEELIMLCQNILAGDRLPSDIASHILNILGASPSKTEMRDDYKLSVNLDDYTSYNSSGSRKKTTNSRIHSKGLGRSKLSSTSPQKLDLKRNEILHTNSRTSTSNDAEKAYSWLKSQGVNKNILFEAMEVFDPSIRDYLRIKPTILQALEYFMAINTRSSFDQFMNSFIDDSFVTMLEAKK
ncbi:hypothetical protein [Vibrio atlanticus]|uniref:Uncharacterized protein n=1 Tax=Vibrio atlanticus TaxID=693153 RepID=A0A1C3IPU3_9VIBR|nr:hypothetical protein [Vibrio atlanticus]SBS63410.1 hypothetical protein VAT7223_01659 [Vibrio atlanticus]